MLKLFRYILLFTVLHTVYVPFPIKKDWHLGCRYTDHSRIFPIYSILQCEEWHGYNQVKIDAYLTFTYAVLLVTHTHIDNLTRGFGLIICACLWQSFVLVTHVLFGRKMSTCDITKEKLHVQLIQIWSFANKNIAYILPLTFVH